MKENMLGPFFNFLYRFVNVTIIRVWKTFVQISNKAKNLYTMVYRFNNKFML